MTVSGNTIYGREEKVNNANYNGWAGVYITKVQENVVISGNTIQDTAYVAVRTTGGGATITNNTISECRDERIINASNGSVVTGNTLDGEDFVLPANDGSKIFVSAGITGKEGDSVICNGVTCTIGTDAFASFTAALQNVSAATTEIVISGTITEAGPASNTTITLSQDLKISGGNVTWTSLGGWVYFTNAENVDATLTFDGVTFNGTAARKAVYFGTDTVVDSDSKIEFYNSKIQSDATVQVLAGGQFNSYTEALNIDGNLSVKGNDSFKAAEAELADRQTFIQRAM